MRNLPSRFRIIYSTLGAVCRRTNLRGLRFPDTTSVRVRVGKERTGESNFCEKSLEVLCAGIKGGSCDITETARP